MRFFLAPLTENLAVMGFLIFYMPKMPNSGRRIWNEGPKNGVIVFGAAALLVIGYSIYNIVTGKDVGFQEVIAMGALMMMFFSSITWGNKAENDGFFMDDELGQKITEKARKSVTSFSFS